MRKGSLSLLAQSGILKVQWLHRLNLILGWRGRQLCCADMSISPLELSPLRTLLARTFFPLFATVACPSSTPSTIHIDSAQNEAYDALICSVNSRFNSCCVRRAARGVLDLFANHPALGEIKYLGLYNPVAFVSCD